MFYLAVGQRGRVRPLLEAAERTDSILDRSPADSGAWLKGALAYADGRYPEAIELLTRAAEKTLCTNCVFPDLARAYDAAGQPREAAEMYQRYVTTPWLFRYEYDATELGWAFKRLAELKEQLGDRQGAREAWEKLLALWDKADPELRPILDTARVKLSRLQ
jgi:tetratricopeptide (TPR) repeat protein